MINRDLLLSARQTDLVAWLKANSYPLERKGKNYHLRGFGGLMVKDNMWKQFSTGEGGNAVDLLTQVFGFTFHEAVAKLTNQSMPIESGPSRVPSVPKFCVPEVGLNSRRVIAYLTKTRKIPADLVISLLKRNLLWQDKRGNCVFPVHDDKGQVVGAMLRGTMSGVRWVGTSPGSDVKNGWIMPGLEGSRTVVVVESPIEAMSLYTLQPRLRGNTFLALGGLHWESLRTKIERGEADKVVLALNPDKWGKLAAAEIAAWLEEKKVPTEIFLPSAREDWNAELASRDQVAR